MGTRHMRLLGIGAVLVAVGLGAAHLRVAGAPAARLGDMTTHGGIITTGCPTVLIGGKPAARMGDTVVCPLVVPPGIPHIGGTIATGSATVRICGMPAARVGDVIPEAGPPSAIAIGEPTVLIGG